MATREDLATAVLEELVGQDSHQAPNAADSEAVLRRYDRKLVNLQDDNLADWASADAIPDGAMTGLTKIMAYECRRMFGAADKISIDLYNEGLSDLANFMCDRPSYEPVRAEYF